MHGELHRYYTSMTHPTVSRTESIFPFQRATEAESGREQVDTGVAAPEGGGGLDASTASAGLARWISPPTRPYVAFILHDIISGSHGVLVCVLCVCVCQCQLVHVL